METYMKIGYAFLSLTVFALASLHAEVVTNRQAGMTSVNQYDASGVLTSRTEASYSKETIMDKTDYGPEVTPASAPVQNMDVRVVKQTITQNTLIGENNQPEWTTRRRFPTTRIYVQQPPGSLGVAQWWRMDDSEGINPRHRFRTEVEYGLAKQVQLDLYIDTIYSREKEFDYNDTALELRYALAEWGKILMNPTLYGEYKFVDADMGSDAFELKLLLGDSVGDFQHGVNLVWEQETGGEKTTEYQVSQALGYTIKDRKWSIGEEFKYVNETVEGSRGDAENKYSFGPSIQYRPTKSMHIDLVALFGLSEEAPDIETFVVVGYSFGPDDEGPRAPRSTGM